MLTRSWLPRKRILVIIIAITIIIVFVTLSDLQYRPSELVAGLHIPSYEGSSSAEQETGKQLPLPQLMAKTYVDPLANLK